MPIDWFFQSFIVRGCCPLTTDAQVTRPVRGNSVATSLLVVSGPDVLVILESGFLSSESGFFNTYNLVLRTPKPRWTGTRNKMAATLDHGCTCGCFKTLEEDEAMALSLRFNTGMDASFVHLALPPIETPSHHASH